MLWYVIYVYEIISEYGLVQILPHTYNVGPTHMHARTNFLRIMHILC